MSVEYASEIYAVGSPKGCECDSTDTSKVLWITAWVISIILFLVILINKFKTFIYSPTTINIMLVVAVLLSLISGFFIYNDACLCKEKRYSKWYASLWLMISVITSIVFVFIRGWLTKLPPKPLKIDITQKAVELPPVRAVQNQ
jgi:hypothetical protein